MIMEMTEIKEVVENAQFGDEVTIHVRDSDLSKGIPVPINSAKMKIVIHDTLIINLELHEYEIVGNLDKYTLFSTDESKEYREELVVHDKWKLLDEKYCIEFEGLKKNLNYTLTLNLANSDNIITIFENLSYKDMKKR
jgi:hypothetical protein